MELFQAINDRNLLQAIAKDLYSDVEIIKSAGGTTLFGSEPVELVDISKLLSVLSYLQTEEAPMWQLQYMFWIVCFLSDTLLSSLKQGTPQIFYDAWVHGPPNSLRQRVQNHLLGKYSEKSKKGSRKLVTCCASSPHMAITEEFLLIYTLTTTTQI